MGTRCCHRRSGRKVKAVGTVLVSGVANGFVLALIGVGIVVIARPSGVINFAQGELVTIGAIAYLIAGDIHAGALGSFCLVVAMAAALGLCLFIVTEILLSGADHFTQVMGTFASSLLIVGVLTDQIGTEPRHVDPWFLGSHQLAIGSVNVTGNELTMIALPAILVVATGLLLRQTRFGKAIEAVSEDRRAASLCGISPRLVIAFSWILAGALAGVAGLLVSPIGLASPSTGASYLFPAFVAATIGSFRSLGGTVIGGVSVGIIQALASRYLSSTAGGLLSASAVFIVLLAVMLLKPSGFVRSRSVRI